MISREALLKISKAQNYKPEILEKVYQLLFVLKQFMAVPFLKERLVLKGGTALNLFYFDEPQIKLNKDHLLW